MPWDSLQDMPWIGHIEPAGAPMLRGAQAGAAVASSWQRSRQLKLEEKAMGSSGSGGGLSSGSLGRDQAQIDLNKLEMEKEQFGLDEMKRQKLMNMQADRLAPEGNEILSTIVGAGQSGGINSPQFVAANAKWNDFLSKNAALSTTPAFRNLLGARDTYVMKRMEQDAKMLELEANVKAGKFQHESSAIGIEEKLNEFESKAEAARQLGTPEGSQTYQDLRRRADDLRNLSTKKGQDINLYGPDGNPVASISNGGSGGQAMPGPKVAPAMAGKSQEMIAKYQNASELIHELLANIRPEDVGVRGLGGGFVFDKLGPQLGLDSANKERIDNQAALTWLQEGLLGTITDDKRMSDQDRKELKRAVSNEASTSYPVMIGNLLRADKIMKQRSNVYSERTGLPVPSFARTPEDLKKSYDDAISTIDRQLKENRIKPEQAAEQKRAAYKQHREIENSLSK